MGPRGKSLLLKVMKKQFLLTSAGGLLLAFVFFLLMGAAAPSPLQRNNFSTNVPGEPVIGGIIYSNGDPANVQTNYLIFSGGGIQSLSLGSRSIYKLYGWVNNTDKAFDWCNSASQLKTNGSGLFTGVNAGVVPITAAGATGQGVNYLQVMDGAANVIGFFRTNAMWQTTNDFYATLQTTDNTTNVILTITMRDNTAVRVSATTVGWNSTSSASTERIAAFKSVAGTVTQVGATATLGLFEDDAAYETLLDTAANVIRLRVAGNTAKTVNWKAYVSLLYGE